MASFIEMKIGDTKTTALAGIPKGNKNGSGIVVSHHKCGLDDTTSKYVDLLTDAGFSVIAPNHYHVMPEGTSIDERRKYLKDEQYKIDLLASIEWLEKNGTDTTRLGLLGHCAGGRTTWVGLEALPNIWRCGCVWYGGGIFKPYGNIESPFARLGRLNCPVMGFFGDLDHLCTQEDVNKTEAELQRLKKNYQFFRYNANHAFASYHDERFDSAAAEDSWSKAIPFLKEHLN